MLQLAASSADRSQPRTTTASRRSSRARPAGSPRRRWRQARAGAAGPCLGWPIAGRAASAEAMAAASEARPRPCPADLTAAPPAASPGAQQARRVTAAYMQALLSTPASDRCGGTLSWCRWWWCVGGRSASQWPCYRWRTGSGRPAMAFASSVASLRAANPHEVPLCIRSSPPRRAHSLTRARLHNSHSPQVYLAQPPLLFPALVYLLGSLALLATPSA